MTDEEYAKYRAMSPNEMVPGKRPPFEENFPVNPILKPVAPANNAGIASVIKNQPSASEMGPPKDLMDSTQMATAEPKKDTYSSIMDMLKGQQKQIGEQREQDKWLALLQGSLGTMAGTSPYALQNIGAGGAKGIAEYAAAKKQRGAEESDILSQMIGLQKVKGLEDYQNKMANITGQHYGQQYELGKARNKMEEARLNQLQQQHGEELGLRYFVAEQTGAHQNSLMSENKIKNSQIALQQYENNAIRALDSRYDKNMKYKMGDPAEVSKYNSEKNAIYTNPRYLDLQNQAFPNVDFSTPQTKTDNVLRFDNKGNPIK